MEITIKATPKEIADLVREVQSQQQATTMSISFDITNRNTDDLVIENNQEWNVGSYIRGC